MFMCWTSGLRKAVGFNTSVDTNAWMWVVGMPGAVQIELSEEEAAAVARLEGMGFDHQLCLEAFLACDRNEELAANYLLEHSADDM